MAIRLSKSCLSEAEIEAVTDVLRDGYLGMGSTVKDFENDLTTFFGRSAVCVASGTASLQLGLQAADITVGDEVLVPTVTYVASFQAISAVGATPVPIDCNPCDVHMSLSHLKQSLTPKTKAVMMVHYAGHIKSYEEIYAWATSHNLIILEDAAHAFGAYHSDGQRVGSKGDICCFSFDGIKNITSGEGGCITASDPKVLERIRNMRLLGVERDTEKRYSGMRSWDFEVLEQGWRYHMSNIMAAIGRTQLRRCETLFAKRQQLARSYVQLLEKSEKVAIPYTDFNRHVPHIFPIFLDVNKRDKVKDILSAEGIETGLHYKPNHMLKKYDLGQSLPNAENNFKRLISLPLHPDMSIDDTEKIANIIQGAM